VQDLGKLAPARTLTSLSLEDAIGWQRRNGEAMEAAGNVRHKFSALQDLERRRRLEVDETFGYVLARASEAGLEMPVLDACYRMVKALDRAASA
jgi:ketopantoate reductase